MKILPIKDTSKFLFFCPACQCGHTIDTKVWTFNNDLERPTIRASVLVRGTRSITDDEHDRIMNGEVIEFPKTICHSYVTDGKIEFLNDCTHDLRGQTVELEDV